MEVAHAARVGERTGMRVRMLGGFQVIVEEYVVPSAEWRRRRAKNLVALLALTPGHTLHRDQILDAFWPDATPQSAANSLYQTLHIARRILCPQDRRCGYLELRAEMLRLSTGEPPWIDTEAFEKAAKQAQQSTAPAQYLAALNLYTGELLPQDLYEEWAERPRDRLQRTYLALLMDLARLHETREEHAPAIEALRRVVEANPLEEKAHTGLMRLYARAGQREAALAQYSALARVLREKLGTEPLAEHIQLYQDIQAGRVPVQPEMAEHLASEVASRDEEPVVQEPPTNLPVQLTSFVGRDREKAEYLALLRTHRLITLTGPGGCGKTRLALEIAVSAHGSYRDGIWLVELANLNDPALIPQAIATALGVRDSPGQPPLDALLAALHTRQLLLILDNCEHLIDASARMGQMLLQHCPSLHLLTTSREPLHIPGEITCLVPSLTLPNPNVPHAEPPEKLLAYESVRLFRDRAQAVLPSFQVTGENAAAIVKICHQLDGIPLALELAATRLRALSAEQVATRLNDAFSLLLGGSRTALTRQQTLRATLDWSHDLLSDAERAVFRRLAIFAGGFTLEAVGAICYPEPDSHSALETFTQLVDKSLVVVERPMSRYRLLETIRQYALEHLLASGEESEIRVRHRDWYLALAEHADAGLRGQLQGEWLARVSPEHDNWRAVLRRTLRNGEIEEGLRVAGALWRFWYMRGHLREGRRWLEELITRAEDLARTGTPVAPTALATALNGAGALADTMGEPRRAVELHEKSLAIRRVLGDKAAIASTLNDLANALSIAGEYSRATAGYEEGLALNRELGNEWGIALLLGNLGTCTSEQGRYEQAAAMFEEVYSLFTRVGGTREIAYALNDLGDVSFRLGRLDVAREHFERGLALFREQDDTQSIALVQLGLGHVLRAAGDASGAARHYAESLSLCNDVGDLRDAMSDLEGIAGVLTDIGHHERAAVLFAAASNARARLALPRPPSDRARIEQDEATIRHTLGVEAFQAAWALGQAMATDEGIAYALATNLDAS